MRGPPPAELWPGKPDSEPRTLPRRSGEKARRHAGIDAADAVAAGRTLAGIDGPDLAKAGGAARQKPRHQRDDRAGAGRTKP